MTVEQERAKFQIQARSIHAGAHRSWCAYNYCLFIFPRLCGWDQSKETFYSIIKHT